MACFARIIRLGAIKHSLCVSRNLTSKSAPTIKLIPHISLINNHWIYQQNDRIIPPVPEKARIELPNGLTWVPPMEDPISNMITPLEMPPAQEETKEAARLIVIRRKKMKKHKLKKLRKRMKYEWAKRRQRRELKKEKAFQAILIQQCKDGEAFSAEKYVEERLSQLNQCLKEEKYKRVKLSVLFNKH